jgi:hypothetical protein
MKRQRKNLRLSLEQGLASYALAASAAGVGILALAQRADAKIVYSPAHVVLRGDSLPYWLDLNHDGVPDFELRNWIARGASSSWNSVSVASPVKGENAVEATRGKFRTYADALDRGASIGSKAPFDSLAMMVASGNQGPWYKVTNSYLGVKLQIKGKYHYGWARLTVQGRYDRIVATLTGYAYETTANKPIIAGKTRGPDAITIEPGSLGQLARGALNMKAHQRP